MTTEARDVRVFVSVRDRAVCTKACVESIAATGEGRTAIHLFDNHSGPEFATLHRRYGEWVRSGLVAQVVMNTPASMPGAYWTKNTAWRQFLALMQGLPPESCRYIVMADNDVVAERGWLSACLAMFHSEEARAHGIAFVSPYDGAPIYETNLETKIGGVWAAVRPRAVSRFWFADAAAWLAWPAPTDGVVDREGKPDRMPTDAWYWNLMERRDMNFAVMKPPLVHDPGNGWRSARMDNGIGADCRRPRFPRRAGLSPEKSTPARPWP